MTRSGPGDQIRIHYRRPPDREDLFEQRIVYEAPDVIVTLADHTVLRAPIRVAGEVILEPGSSVVWFTFPGAWHDIGRFHLADGTFTGIYANVLTPPVIQGRVWRTTDLFLDVWLPRAGAARILDEEELEAALALGHLDAATAARAREEASRIMALLDRGAWPPPVVATWTLERARGTDPADQPSSSTW